MAMGGDVVFVRTPSVVLLAGGKFIAFCNAASFLADLESVANYGGSVKLSLRIAGKPCNKGGFEERLEKRLGFCLRDVGKALRIGFGGKQKSSSKIMLNVECAALTPIFRWLS